MEIICKDCKREPNQIPYYNNQAIIENLEPDDIARDDGTYNFKTREFYCMTCYVARGCPLGTA